MLLKINIKRVIASLVLAIVATRTTAMVSAKDVQQVWTDTTIMKAYDDYNNQKRLQELNHLMQLNQQKEAEDQYKRIEGMVGISSAQLNNSLLKKNNALEEANEKSSSQRRKFWQQEFSSYIIQEHYAKQGYRQALSSQVTSYVLMELNRNRLQNSQEVYTKNIAKSRMDFEEQLYQFGILAQKAKVASLALESTQSKYKTAQIKNKNDIITKSQLQQVEDQLKMAERNRDTAELDKRISQEQILRAIGKTETLATLEIEIKTEPNVEIVSFDSYKKLVQSQSEEFEVLNLKKDLLASLKEKLHYLKETEKVAEKDKYDSLLYNQEKESMGNDKALMLQELRLKQIYQGYANSNKRLDIAKKRYEYAKIDYEQSQRNYKLGKLSAQDLKKAELKYEQDTLSYKEQILQTKREENNIVKSIYGVQ